MPPRLGESRPRARMPAGERGEWYSYERRPASFPLLPMHCGEAFSKVVAYVTTHVQTRPEPLLQARLARPPLSPSLTLPPLARETNDIISQQAPMQIASGMRSARRQTPV